MLSRGDARRATRREHVALNSLVHALPDTRTLSNVLDAEPQYHGTGATFAHAPHHPFGRAMKIRRSFDSWHADAQLFLG